MSAEMEDRVEQMASVLDVLLDTSSAAEATEAVTRMGLLAAAASPTSAAVLPRGKNPPLFNESFPHLKKPHPLQYLARRTPNPLYLWQFG